MFHGCSRMLLLGIMVVMADSLTTGLMEDVSKADQAMRPKAKRVQELLMFGNQQNRRAENVPAASSNVYAPNSEKRTLGTSGLEDVKAALAEGETFGRSKQPGNSMFDRDEISPYEKTYEYGKVLSNDISPRNWDVPPYYPRYYSIGEEDRRKRSEKSTISTTSTTVSPSSSPTPATTQATQESVAQAKRSIPIYQEPRYKRALDREEFLTLLSLWENSPRNRNWRNYGNDDYENVEDDSGVVGLDEDQDPRNDGAWMVEPPRHFSTPVHAPQAISPFDIGIPRTHPVNSYDQYEQPQYPSPYENTQYGGAQYGALYPSQSYYQPEKRFMVRKRSQAYDSYSGRNDLASLSRLMGSQPQVYPNYPHRLVY